MKSIKITASYVAQQLQYLRSLQDYDVPAALTEELDFNRLKGVLTTVGTEPSERPYTPLVKQLMPTEGRIPLTNHLYPQEIEYIYSTAQIINKHYGSPVFDYSEVTPEEYPRVDNGINLFKTMSPLITPGASERRAENLAKYNTQQYIFKPDGNILKQSIAHVEALMFTNGPVYAEDLIAGSYKSPFEKQTSNVGGPFYANETKIHPSGLRYKEYTVKKTKEGIEKYGTQGLAVVPSAIIGRDQQGGLNVDLSEIRDVQSLPSILSRNDILKPSKARVVWATPRVANNALAPVVHPITEYLKENSPLFCGYLDRPRRAILMESARKLTEQLKLQSANVDYSAYDLTVPPELSIIGATILLNNCVMSDTQRNTLGSMVSNFIGTPYISLNPKNNHLFTGSKSGGIPSGSILTNILGSIVNAVASTYAKMKMYGVLETETTDRKYAKIGAPSITVLGDDVWTGFKQASDIKPFSKILKDDFNFDVSGDGNKTAYGVFFLQERHIGGKVLYPTARSVAKSLGVERPKGLNGTLGDLGFASKLANMESNPDLMEVTAMLQALDKTRLGLYNPEGMRLTPREFAKATAYEASKHQETPMQSLYDGDPSKIDRFDVNSGQPSSKFINGYFELLSSDTVEKLYPTYKMKLSTEKSAA